MTLFAQRHSKARQTRHGYGVARQSAPLRRRQFPRGQLRRGQRVVAEDLRRCLVLDQHVRGGYAGTVMLGGQLMQVSVERRFTAIEAFTTMYPAVQPLNDEHRSATRQAAFHRLLEPRVGRKRLI